MRSKADETFLIVETLICPLQISYVLLPLHYVMIRKQEHLIAYCLAITAWLEFLRNFWTFVLFIIFTTLKLFHKVFAIATYRYVLLSINPSAWGSLYSKRLLITIAEIMFRAQRTMYIWNATRLISGNSQRALIVNKVQVQPTIANL